MHRAAEPAGQGRHLHQQPLGRTECSHPPQYSPPHTVHRIGAVITAARGQNLAATLPKHIEYLYLPAVDHESFDISQYFGPACDLLAEELPRTNVLVHCMAGVSRSATLVIAFLMRSRAVSFTEAFSLVKSRRKIVPPQAYRSTPTPPSSANYRSTRPPSPPNDPAPPPQNNPSRTSPPLPAGFRRAKPLQSRRGAVGRRHTTGRCVNA